MKSVGRIAILCVLIAQACKPDARNIMLAARASDSLTLAFADSEAQRIAASKPQPPPVRANLTSACEDPDVNVEFIEQRSGPLALSLPADFKPIDTARIASHGVYRWLGADKSTLVVRAEGASYHSGSTGLLTNECTVEITGARAHIDLLDASVGVPDYVVRAVLERPGMVSFVFEAHARSVASQANLLHALRSFSIDERAWIVLPSGK